MRRLFLILFALAATTGALLVLYGFAEAWRDPQVARYRVAIAGLDRPLRIVQLSDSHGGGLAMPADRLRRVVAQVNALRPDLVVLTGDYIYGYPPSWTDAEARTVLAPFGALAAPLGVVAVLGNHDGLAMTRAGFAGTNVRLLVGDAVDVGPIIVVGADDLMSPRAPIAGLRQAVRAQPAGKPVIAISHEPEFFQWLPRRAQLLIAGHTHGGQIVLPLIGPAYDLNAYLAAHRRGLFREHGQSMVVSSGLGTTLLPIRIGVPPEVVAITLVPAPDHSVGRKSGTDR